MSRNLMRMALIMAATAAYAQGDVFGSTSPKLNTPKGNTPSDKKKCQPKDNTTRIACSPRVCY